MDNPFVSRQEVHMSNLSFRGLDVVVLALTAPFLLAAGYVSHVASGVAVLLLLVPYIARLLLNRPLTRPTIVNLPVAIIALVFLPLAFLMSPAPWGLTWQRIAVLAWSISLFFTVVNWPNPGRGPDMRTRFNQPTVIYLVSGFLVTVVSLLGMRSVDKLFFLPQTGWLADTLGWEAGLPTNEIAGVLTLFIPFVVALVYGCWITERRRSFFLLLPLALLMLATLVLTQSRTGLAATVVGMVLALAINDTISRKKVMIGLAFLVIGFGLVLLTPIRDWFVFAGANSWNSVVGPRLGIWHQALDALSDHPLWGFGLGLFGELARFMYPLSTPEAGPILEDAHNLYLQTALDFGLAGLLVFLVMAALVLSSAIRLVRIRPTQTLSRLWAAGLLGALVAHALYSITDAVSLGTLAGVPLWFVFGLVMGASRGRLEMRWSNAGRMAFGGAVVLVLVTSALGLSVNRAGQLATYAMVDPAADVDATSASIGELAAGSCRAGWYEGVLRHFSGDPDGRGAAWRDLLDCSTKYTGYMAVLAADDTELARHAIAAQPLDAAGYFWLASSISTENPGEAIERYKQGLMFAPEDGHRWLALADLLEPRDKMAALDAYLMACRNGDPGANGCLRAGAIVESTGDIPTAIEYYRLSKWSGALERADELERLLVADQP